MRLPGLGSLLTIAIANIATAKTCLAAESDIHCENHSDPHGLSTLCGFAKPEDVQFIRSKSLVIVSEQGWQAPESGGSISVVDVDSKAARLGVKRTLWPAPSDRLRDKSIGDPGCTEPPLGAFSPHGLSVLERRSHIRVAIMNHGGREAVELFDLRDKKGSLSLEWRGCVPLPPETAGNDVAIHSDGRLFVTNYIPTVHDVRGILATIAALRGQISGDVLEWTPGKGWRHLPGTEGAMPNGIVVDESRHTLFVAELGKQRVLEFEMLRKGGIAKRREFAFQDSADNLNWTAHRTLLVAGQTKKDSKKWSAAEIDIKSGTVRTVYEHQTAIHSVTSATDIGKGIVFGSTADQRIAVAPWPK